MRHHMLSRVPDGSGERSRWRWNYHIVPVLPLRVDFVAFSSERRINARAGTRSGVRVVRHELRFLRLSSWAWVHRSAGGGSSWDICILLWNLHWWRWRRRWLTLPWVNWILVRRGGDRGRKDRNDGRNSIRVRVWRRIGGRALPPSSLSSSVSFLLPLSNSSMFHRILG